MKSILQLSVFINPLNINEEYQSKESMAWYNSLPINAKINLKEITPFIVGVSWDALSSMFNHKEKTHILYTKLKLEGFKI